MPLADPNAPQLSGPPAVRRGRIRQALVGYVASLGNGPAIPNVVVSGADVNHGRELYVANCSACHGPAGGGGAVGGGFVAPALTEAGPTTVGEAVITGPGPMPRFSFSPEELNDIAAYALYLRNAPHPGGATTPATGPVTEGFIAGIALLALLLVARWVAVRREGRPEPRGHAVSPDDPATRRVERAIGVAFLVARDRTASRCSASTSTGARPSSRPCCWHLPRRDRHRDHLLGALAALRHRTRRGPSSLASPADVSRTPRRRDGVLHPAHVPDPHPRRRVRGAGRCAGDPGAVARPGAGPELFETPWKDGQPRGPADGLAGHTSTSLAGRRRAHRVPGGRLGSADGQTLLIRVAAGAAPAAARPRWPGRRDGLRRVLEGLHARRLPGRAVPRRRAQAHLPVPPVDVRRPRRRHAVFGPAARPLPQLPIQLPAGRDVRRTRRLPGAGRAGFWDIGRRRMTARSVPSDPALTRAPSSPPPTPAPTELERVFGWLDERTGVADSTRTVLRKVFPDHWSFLLGEIALFCFVILVVTGIFLTFFFVPDARADDLRRPYAPLPARRCRPRSTRVMRLSFEVKAGLLMRQIHHWAALVFVGAIACTCCRVFFTGAFRRPREINW